jgi:hypothetical protein
MRRQTSLAAILLMLAAAMTASGQFQRPTPRAHRAWLTLSDGIGPSGGGITGSSGLSQLLRAAATVNVASDYGFELMALRIQETFPARKLLSDPTLNSPRADGVMLSFAQLNPDGRGRGFPASAVLGGGVVQRPTNDPDKKHLTGAFQLGVEGNVWRPPVSWADASMGLRAILMPSGNRRQIYLIALTMGIRVG